MRDIDTCHVALQEEAQEEAQEPCRRPLLQRGPCISPRGSALIDPSAPEVWPGLLVAGLLQIPAVCSSGSTTLQPPPAPCRSVALPGGG